MDYIKKMGRLLFGLFIYSVGIMLGVQANIGLAPWDAFHWGISLQTGISFGTVTTLVGVVILVVAALLKEPFGIGTILNILIIGNFVDIIQTLNIIPLMDNLFQGVVMLLTGQFLICLGTYFYVGVSLGAGPRDSVMAALTKRFKSVPVGVIRGLIEGSVLFVGYLLGAKIGIGTFIAVFGISFFLQGVCHVFKFDISAVEHENIVQTLSNIKSKVIHPKQDMADNTLEPCDKKSI